MIRKDPNFVHFGEKSVLPEKQFHWVDDKRILHNFYQETENKIELNGALPSWNFNWLQTNVSAFYWSHFQRLN